MTQPPVHPSPNLSTNHLLPCTHLVDTTLELIEGKAALRASATLMEA